jgi:hypothetical protein
VDDGRAVPLDGRAGSCDGITPPPSINPIRCLRGETSSLPGRVSETARFFLRRVRSRVEHFRADTFEDHDAASSTRPRREQCTRRSRSQLVNGRRRRDVREPVRPRSIECAIVLGRIKAEPRRGGRRSAASLDTPCARWRWHPAVGMKVSLRRGRTKVIGFAAVDGRRLGPARAHHQRILLAESAAIREQRNVRKKAR